MASVAYNDFKRGLLAGEYDLDASGDDIRARLVMTNTTCDTEVDAINQFTDFTAIDLMDGSGYVDKAFSSEAVAADDTANQGEFDGEDLVWTSLGNGTRDIAGVVIYKFVDGTDANDIPLFFVEFTSPQSPGGSDFTIEWDANDKILNLS